MQEDTQLRHFAQYGGDNEVWRKEFQTLRPGWLGWQSRPCVRAKSLQSCLTLCDPMDCSSPGFSVHGILQARILERDAIPSSWRSSWPRDRTQASYISCIGRKVLYKQHHLGSPNPDPTTWQMGTLTKLLISSSPVSSCSKGWEFHLVWASLVVQTVKNLPAMQKTWVWSLHQEDPLKEGMAIHSSILAWRIPWTEEPGRLHIVHGVKKSQTGLKN